MAVEKRGRLETVSRKPVVFDRNIVGNLMPRSFPLRGRGLKDTYLADVAYQVQIAPFSGAWIETEGVQIWQQLIHSGQSQSWGQEGAALR